jgi:hypothetical protein
MRDPLKKNTMPFFNLFTSFGYFENDGTTLQP